MTDHSNSQITIRLLGEGDSDQLRRLAERDSAIVPNARMLGAERNGRLIAAVSLTGTEGAIMADPFELTKDAVALLKMRLSQIQGVEIGEGRHPRLGRLRSPRRAHAALAGSPPGGGARLLQL
jgi:hypothetical protein